MKYHVPGLAPTDVRWRTHNTSKQFPAMHVKFSNIICTTTSKICGRDAIKTILSQKMYVWTWNASAAFCNRWSISSFCLPALSVDNIQPSQLLDSYFICRTQALMQNPRVTSECSLISLVWSEHTNYNNQIRWADIPCKRKPRHKTSQSTQSNASYTFALRIHNGLLANKYPTMLYRSAF